MKRFLVVGLAILIASSSAVYAKENVPAFDKNAPVLISMKKPDRHFDRHDKKRPEIKHHQDKGCFDKKDDRRPDIKRHNQDKGRFDKRDDHRKDIKRPDRKHQNFNKKNDRHHDFKKGNNGNHYGQHKNKSKGKKR